MTAETLLNFKQVQETLGVSESTLLRLLKNKELKGFKVGRTWRFEPEDIERYIQQQREKGLSEVSQPAAFVEPSKERQVVDFDALRQWFIVATKQPGGRGLSEEEVDEEIAWMKRIEELNGPGTIQWDGKIVTYRLQPVTTITHGPDGKQYVEAREE